MHAQLSETLETTFDRAIDNKVIKIGISMIGINIKY